MELLVVVAIILILLALVTPAITGALRTSGLASSVNLVVDQLALARQTAITRNQRVEVRFYRLADANGGPQAWRAMRTLLLPENGDAKKATPLGRVYQLSAPTIISSSMSLTTLLKNPPPAAQTENLAQFANISAPYSKFRFYPSGQAADIDGADPAQGPPWLLTLYVDTAKTDNGNTVLPANYALLQLDDFTGKVRIFRP